MVWLGFFEKNVFLRTSGVRAKPSKRISTFSVAKGLIVNKIIFFQVKNVPKFINVGTRKMCERQTKAGNLDLSLFLSLSLSF